MKEKISPGLVLRLMQSEENHNLEFKEAKNTYSLDKVLQYCVALANEGGGKLILGITDKIPRVVCGTKAFENTNKLEQDLYAKLHFRVEVFELFIDNKRILGFDVPPRPMGYPRSLDGQYLMRVGESLQAMSPETLRKIFDEVDADFSSVSINLDSIEFSNESEANLRRLLVKKKNDVDYKNKPLTEILVELELLVNNKLNNAALILLGNQDSLRRLLPQAEIIYEYRDDESKIESQKRIEWTEGFLAVFEKIWETVDQRNDSIRVQDGLFAKDITMFNEEVVREALLNAVCHRDYKSTGSIIIKQYKSKISFENPGGFPAGITIENILEKHIPRNRKLAEVFQKLGLVERSGQGVDRMFKKSIEESKPLPDYSRTDNYWVVLELAGLVEDKEFVKFIYKIASESNIYLTTKQLIILDRIRRGEKIPPAEQQNLTRLKEFGLIEVFNRGRGTKYLLTSKYYATTNQKGVKTRLRGLLTPDKQLLILRHIEENGYITYAEITQILNNFSRNQISGILKSLKHSNKIKRVGSNRTGYWVLNK